MIETQAGLIDIFNQSIKLRERIMQDATWMDAFHHQASMAIQALQSGHRLFFAGNGGSMSDAQHITAEFVGRFKLERQSLPAICLGNNPSSISAIANDYGYEEVFSRELSGLATRGDIVFGLTTSGNSNNIIKLVEQANHMGITHFIWSGKDGGNLKHHPHNLIVPSNDTARIQEIHITLGHGLCQMVDDEFERKKLTNGK